jgi:lipid II:glycine glycyltransferase (peptidoglycan interpeptide bridge formation enzyme)
MTIVSSLKQLDLNEDIFPMFYKETWLDIERNTKKDAFLYYDDEMKIVVPFIKYRIKFITVAIYLFSPYTSEGEKPSPGDEKLFFERFHLYLEKNRICDVIFPLQHNFHFQAIPDDVDYYRLDLITLDINKSADLVLKGFAPNYRNEINKSIKAGTTVLFGEQYLPDFYQVFKKTHKKQGIEVESYEHLLDMLSRMPQNIHVGVAVQNQQTLASLYNFYDSHNVYYAKAGTVSSKENPGANKHLLFEAIKYYQEKKIKHVILGGYRNIDNVNSKYYNIQKFKLRFGAEIRQGYHFVKVINHKRYGLFNFLMKAKALVTGKKLFLLNMEGFDVKKS